MTGMYPNTTPAIAMPFFSRFREICPVIIATMLATIGKNVIPSMPIIKETNARGSSLFAAGGGCWTITVTGGAGGCDCAYL